MHSTVSAISMRYDVEVLLFLIAYNKYFNQLNIVSPVRPKMCQCRFPFVKYSFMLCISLRKKAVDPLKEFFLLKILVVQTTAHIRGAFC